MQTYTNTQLGQHRGSPRVWLQGRFPARAGFVRGVKYSLIPMEAGGVALRITEDGDRTVSGKEVRGKEVPVIDINSREDLKDFVGLTQLRVVMQDGEILIMPTATERKVRERTGRMLAKLADNKPLDVGALAYGGGILDHAMHEGMALGGIETSLAFANEIREDLVEHAAEHNPTFTARTTALVAPMQDIAFDDAAMSRVPKVDLLYAGIPCSGASVAGRAKRGLSQPEEHPLVGHLIAAAIVFIAKVNPFAVVIENVPQYQNTGSASILRNQLRDLGYITHECELLGTDYGDLEKRKRWCFVAITQGCDLRLEDLLPEPFEVRTLSQIQDPLSQVEDRWSEMPGLKAKLERDRAAGKGFEMQIYTGTENSVATLTKGISKNRSTDPKFQHPENPNLLRIPTANEHARCKGVPESLIEGLSQTTAHELLGQGICYAPFKALGRHLAQSIRYFASITKAPSAQVFEFGPKMKVAG